MPSESHTLPRRIHTAEEFRAMAETGVMDEDHRLELIDGVIVEMGPIGRRHAACVMRLTELFQSVLDRAHIAVQNPLAVSRESEFYPDLMLLERREDHYAERIPEVQDALLIIEVADTTLEKDRTVKLSRYAAAGAREVWIVDIEGRRVLVSRRPQQGRYAETYDAQPGDTLTIEGIRGFTVEVAKMIS